MRLVGELSTWLILMRNSIVKEKMKIDLNTKISGWEKLQVRWDGWRYNEALFYKVGCKLTFAMN